MPQSVKVETKKQLTVVRKQVQEMYWRMLDLPYLCVVLSEDEDNQSFLKQFENDIPIWKRNFEYLGNIMLGLLDEVDRCEAACREAGAKIPAHLLHTSQGWREWLAQFDITAKSKPVQTPKVPQPFERTPNADDAHYMRGMSIRWDN